MTPDQRKRTTGTVQFPPQDANAEKSDRLGRLRNDMGEPPLVEDTEDIVRAEYECVDISREGEPLHLLAVHVEPQDYELLLDLPPPHDQDDQNNPG